MRLPRFSIRIKMLASTVLVLVLVSTFMAVYYPARHAQSAREALETRTRRAADMVALGVGIGVQLNQLGTVSAAVNWAKQDSSLVYLLVADLGGQIFAEFNPTERVIDLEQERRRVGLVVERDELMETAVSVTFQERAVGTLYLGMSMVEMRREVALFRNMALLVSLIALIIGATVAMWLADRVSRPLRELHEAASRVAEGDYSDPPVPRGRDEVASLATAFSVMTGRIRESLQTLEAQASELALARDDAIAAAKAKADFLATMSHEIRTPMNGMLGMLELLAATEITSGQREYIATASGSGQALLKIIDDILDFSKIDAGRLSIERVPVDIRVLIDEVVNLLAERATAKGVVISGVVSRDLPSFIYGDPVRLRQILLNLGGNAVKFTEEGGVRIGVQLEKDGDRQSQILFRVEDTGVGISEDAQTRLFQPFMQADSSTTRRFGGTGLGLSISRRLVELLDGEIGVRSTVGAGSEFWFRIPVGRMPDEHEQPVEPLSGRHILVAAPASAQREPLEENLAAFGASVVVIDEPAAALDARFRETFDLVVMEADHPQAESLETARRIRDREESEKCEPVPIVALGVKPASASAEPLQDASLNGILSYPVTSGALLSSLDRYLAWGDPGADRTTARRALPESTDDRRGVLAGLRVLLVEDNPVNQKVVASMLEHLGAIPSVAADGREALALVGSIECDLALMDCHMPRLDGYAATEEIRRKEAISVRKRLPVIALTASALQGERERCLRAGMDDFLTKPVSLEALADCISRWTDTTSAAGAAGVARAPAAATPDSEPDADPRKPGDKVLDEAALANLSALGSPDGRNPVQMVVEKFLTTTPEYIAQLRNAAAAGDCELLREKSHTLKSSTAMIGALRLSTLCRNAETAARAGDAVAAAALTDQISDEYERVEAALSAMELGGANAA